MLASYTPSGSIYTTTMQYDADGRRCSKTIPTSSQPNIFSYIYNGNNLIRETKSGTSSATKTYLYNSQGIIGFVYQGETYTYRKNMFGDIIAIYSGATKLVEYAYDAFGNCTIVSDTGNIGFGNPFRYRGYYWDNDLQLYYLMSRYYDPQIGRFLNADSLEYLDPETIGGINLYVYCLNNPVMGVDPNGNEWNWCTFWKGLVMTGVAIGAIVASVATFGLATPLAMTIVAGITLGAGILTGINGVATIIEAKDGYNFVRDGLFNDMFSLSDNAYDWYAGVTAGIAIVGTAICTIWNVTNPIKGFTDHGRQSALTHDGHGVNARAMQNAVRNPLEVIEQSNGGIKHVGKNAVVVLNNVGKVITTYAKTHYGWRMMLALWLGSELLQEKLNY